MIERKGNLYIPQRIIEHDYIGFTANSVIKSNGALVMGAGAAKVVRDWIKDIDLKLGAKITPGKDYYIIREGNIFAFQTKRHWSEDTPLDLLSKSIDLLDKSARKFPSKTFALNFPAIGHGGIKKELVLAMSKDLPDNVFYYSL